MRKLEEAWSRNTTTILEANRRFGVTNFLHLQGRKVNKPRNQQAATLLAVCYGLHDAISQKTELFITTAARTSDPT
jgi:hypothetical protein